MNVCTYLSEPESDAEFMKHVAARQAGRDLVVDVFTAADGTALLLFCKTKEMPMYIEDNLPALHHILKPTRSNQIFLALDSVTHASNDSFQSLEVKLRPFMYSAADLSSQTHSCHKAEVAH